MKTILHTIQLTIMLLQLQIHLFQKSLAVLFLSVEKT